METEVKRGPGRPPKAQAQRNRRPMSGRQRKLEAPEIPGYRLYWFNDSPGRIQAAQEAGYEFVNRDEAVLNEFVTPGNQALDTRVSLAVGSTESGQAMRAFLMKIKTEWFEEDQRAAQKANDDIDLAVKHGSVGADQEFTSDGTSHRYMPKNLTTISHTTRRR